MISKRGRQGGRFLATLGLFAVLLAACSSVTVATQPPNHPTTQLPNHPTTQPPNHLTTQPPNYPTTQPPNYPTTTPTAIRTPPALPGVFTTELLNPLDTPHTYLTDTCQYLKAKWDPNNAAPGTVVMVIMFHSISGETNANQLSEADFHALMQKLHDDGFTAIATVQLADFMEHNAKIPSRSVMLLVDDRKYRYYFDTLFYPYWQQYGWPVVNAWISTPNNTADLWQQQVDLESEGWVDHQAHGVVHNTPISEYSPDSYILGELQGSIAAFQEYFHKAPLAFIWPGGGFTPHAAQLARQTGYRLGFTINPRGPLMFDWVPLSDNPDPQRPSYMPEGPVNDPLMVLPRYWDTDAIIHLNEVIQIGQEAAAYAEANRATELEYYDIVCAPAYGPMP